MSLEQRFRAKVEQRGPDDCWPWLAAADDLGYGRISVGGRGTGMVLAHRVAFYLEYGYWPNVCRHTCDNPRCCNPRHLEDGTKADNTQDMMRRGRHRYVPHAGEANASAKVLLKDAARLRELYATGQYTYLELARMSGLSKSQVGNIIRGESWR